MKAFTAEEIRQDILAYISGSDIRPMYSEEQMEIIANAAIEFNKFEIEGEAPTMEDEEALEAILMDAAEEVEYLERGCDACGDRTADGFASGYGIEINGTLYEFCSEKCARRYIEVSTHCDVKNIRNLIGKHNAERTNILLENIARSIESRHKTFMNPATGSVVYGQEWAEDFFDTQEDERSDYG